MHHPFIDTKSLSDEELLKRMARCQDVALAAMGSGQTSMYDSAILQYETYEAVYQERMLQKRHEEFLEKSPDGVYDIGEVKDISPLRKEDPNE
jgi:hypothetical protein